MGKEPKKNGCWAAVSVSCTFDPIATWMQPGVSRFTATFSNHTCSQFKVQMNNDEPDVPFIPAGTVIALHLSET